VIRRGGETDRDHAFMKIYTKTGDDGRTGLLGGGRVGKDDPRIESYGTVDELNAALGVARAAGLDAQLDGWLARVQADLFVLGSALADPDPKGRFHGVVGVDRFTALEEAIDTLDAELPALTNFVLPAGCPAAAQLHLARTICRRAERRVVFLANLPGEDVPDNLVIYLNRLGDFLFEAARAANHRAGVADVPWRGL
jgi:cob(I)alamin adenosyltransferase